MNSNAGQTIQTRGKRLESVASMKEILGELPVMQSVAGYPDVDVSPVTSLTSDSEPNIDSISGEGVPSGKVFDIDLRSRKGLVSESEPDVDVGAAKRLSINKAAVSAEEAETTSTAPILTTILDTETTPLTALFDLFSSTDQPVGVAIRPTSKINTTELVRNASSEFSAKVQFTVPEADVLLAVGSYQQAYSLYSQWWETVRPCRTESAIPSLVFIIGNMSRAASTPAEVAHVLAKMTKLMIRLIRFHAGGGAFDPIAECTLHIQLAILLRRHRDLGNAAHHCQCAVLILETWSAYKSLHHEAYKSLHHEDWGVPANLIGQYIKTAPTNFRALRGEKWCTPYESLQRNSLKADFEYDGALRKLFARCASSLSSLNICQQLAAGLRAAWRPGWDSETMTRALSVLLFCQLWEPFACGCGVHQAQTHLTNEVDWVHKICKGMRTSSPDLFAAIASLLVDLVSPWYTDWQREPVAAAYPPRRRKHKVSHCVSFIFPKLHMLLYRRKDPKRSSCSPSSLLTLQIVSSGYRKNSRLSTPSVISSKGVHACKLILKTSIARASGEML